MTHLLNLLALLLGIGGWVEAEKWITWVLEMRLAFELLAQG